MEPLLDEVATRHPGVTLTRVNSAEDLDMVAGMGVRSTPTIIGFSEGREVSRATGRRTRSELEQIFTSVAEGTTPPRLGHTDAILRLGAAGLLVVLGLISGPSWALVGAGMALAVFGLVAMRDRRH